MSWLLIALAKNAVLVVPLAVLALAASRLVRRPALAHVLWVLVLVKLLTPPLVDVPVGWSVDIGRLLPVAADATPVLAAVPRPMGALAAPQSVGPASLKSAAACDTGPTAAAPQVDTALLPASRSASQECSTSAAPAIVAAWVRLPRNASDWLAIAGGIWLVGSVVTALMMVRRGLAFRRFLSLAAREDELIAGRARALARSVGLRSCPRVLMVEAAISPLLWGLGGKVLLVFPAPLAKRLRPAEIDSLLLHELAHYARGDYWVRLVELAAQVVWWWHPVAWWARREIEAAEEQCCDAWVVQHQTGSRQSYAEALLSTIDFLCDAQPRKVHSAPLPPAVCGLGDVPLLRTRLIKIMRGQFGGQLPRGVGLLVLAAGALLSPLAPAVFATSSARRPGALPQVRMVSAGSIPAAPNDAPAALPPASQASVPLAPPPAELAPLAPPAAPSVTPVSVVFASAQSPSGRFRLQARTGREVTLVHPGLQLGLSSNGITCAAFAPDSRTFLTGHEDGLVRQWDSETGGRLKTFRVNAGPVESVAWSPTGVEFAAGTIDGTLAVWNVFDEVEKARLANEGIAASCIRWSPDGSQIAAALGAWSSTDVARCLVWSPASGQVELDHPLDRPGGALDWLSPSVLIVADWEGSATILELGKPAAQRAVGLDKDIVSAAHWSPDCPLVAPWQAQQLAAAAGP